QWAQLAALWEAMYPRTRLDPERQRLFAALEETLPQFVSDLVGHRPPTLRGHSLAEVMPLAERQPRELARLHRAWQHDRPALRNAAPSLAFAVLGQARALNELTPEDEGRIVGNLLTYWALRSTLDITELCAATQTERTALAAARTSQRSLVTAT